MWSLLSLSLAASPQPSSSSSFVAQRGVTWEAPRRRVVRRSRSLRLRGKNCENRTEKNGRQQFCHARLGGY